MEQQNSSISSFKKFLLRILLPAVLIFIVVGAVFNYFFENKIILGSEISGAYKVNRILNSTEKDEIPFFGSSRCEGTFIPDSLVKKGFNYGLDGTQIDVLLFFLTQECAKKGKTTPIIFNFDLDGFEANTGDKSNYIYNAGNTDIKLLLDTNYKKLYNIPLLKYYGMFETYTKYYMNDRINLTKFTNKGASIEKDEISKQKFESLIKKRLAKKWSFQQNEKWKNDFLGLIEKNKNRKFVMVIAPYHNCCFKSMTNYQDAFAFLNQLRSYENVVLFDFSKLEYPDNYFLNTTHLNVRGALEFNKLLKDSLQRNGII